MRFKNFTFLRKSLLFCLFVPLQVIEHLKYACFLSDMELYEKTDTTFIVSVLSNMQRFAWI